MKKIKWCKQAIDLVDAKGTTFRRLSTPKGWRGLTRKHILPEGRYRIEGNCFHVAIGLARLFPDELYYCEGIADGLPHAWVSLKDKDHHNRCIDVTWPYYTLKDGYRTWNHLPYKGVRFEYTDVKSFMLERLERLGEDSTSLSMLKYPLEIQHLIK